MTIRLSLIAGLLFIIGCTISMGQQAATEDRVIKTLDSFHQAIIDNDSLKANTLLADSAQILEAGKIEMKPEYMSHHFHADGKFLSAMNREIESRNVTIEGNTAWVSTRSHTRGTYKGSKLNLNSLELAVLKKVDGNWRITALHWSSARRD